LQSFGLIVTAEPYFAVTRLSDVVVAENFIRNDTTGTIERRVEMVVTGTPSGIGLSIPRGRSSSQVTAYRSRGRQGAVTQSCVHAASTPPPNPACYAVLTAPMIPIREKAQLMSASEIDRTLVRLAHEVLEKTADLDKLAFIGIRRRGVPLAQRLAAKIEALEKRKVLVGILDINLYRDDLTTVGVKPVVSSTEIPFSVQNLDIVLMDDVLYTGRTVRAALDALFDHGRPARVRLLALIDRGHRELPIEASFVGRTVQTTANEIIEVKFQEIDGMEKVLLVEKSAAEAV